MTARDQLRWLVDEFDDAQAERALVVLESAAEWVLSGELAVVPQRNLVGHQDPLGYEDRPQGAEGRGAKPHAGGDTQRDLVLAAGGVATSGRHSGR